MKQLELEIKPTNKRAIPCTHNNCKKLAWEDIGLDNKRYYFCSKHGVIKLVLDIRQ